MASFMALWTSGRFSVMVPTPSASSYRIASYVIVREPRSPTAVVAGAASPARDVGGLLWERAGSGPLLGISSHHLLCAQVGDGGGVVAGLAEDLVGVLPQQRRRARITRRCVGKDERLAHHAQAAHLG